MRHRCGYNPETKVHNNPSSVCWTSALWPSLVGTGAHHSCQSLQAHTMRAPPPDTEMSCCVVNYFSFMDEDWILLQWTSHTYIHSPLLIPHPIHTPSMPVHTSLMSIYTSLYFSTHPITPPFGCIHSLTPFNTPLQPIYTPPHPSTPNSIKSTLPYTYQHTPTHSTRSHTLYTPFYTYWSQCLL